MFNITIANSSIKCVLENDTPVTIREVCERIEEATALSRDQYYVMHNGRLMYENDICSGHAIVVPRLLGGKGGFGSMLRAIGAQIEKTTNREACRDLSGRRLRDINEEKRLKAWIVRQAKREEEAAERKKKKLEKLCAVPRHEFKDQRYDRERAELTERVGDAVEEGFNVAAILSKKRKLEEDVGPKSNKRKTMLDLDIDSDELETSDDSDSEDASLSTTKKSEASQMSNDSGHSSDDSRRISESTDKVESEESEESSNNQIINEASSIESVDMKSVTESSEN